MLARGALSLLLLCFMPKASSLEKLKIPLTVCLHFIYLANGQMTTLGGSLLTGQPYLRETDCIRSFFLISKGERFQAQKTIEVMVGPACSGDQTLCPHHLVQGFSTLLALEARSFFAMGAVLCSAGCSQYPWPVISSWKPTAALQL